MTFAPVFERTFRPPFWQSSAASGWWVMAGQTCVGAYLASGASQALSYINLATPGTNNLAVVGTAPTWDSATGWGFPAYPSSVALTTGIAPANGNWSLVIHLFSHTSAGLRYALIGGSDGGAGRRMSFWSLYNYTSRAYHNGGAATVYAGAIPVTGAVLAVAGNKAYLDGVPETGTLSAWSGGAGLPIYLGAENGGAVAYGAGGIIRSASIYSTTLSAADVAELTARMKLLPL